MKIAVVGLGLIGGSFCKAIKEYTNHTCLGVGRDLNSKSVQMALLTDAIDRAIVPEELGEADLSIICLHPQGIIDFIKENQQYFRPGSIVIDAGGVKEAIVSEVDDILRERGVIFIGCHPMAGREFSGFAYSLPDLYKGASIIFTPSDYVPDEAKKIVEQLARELKFGRVVYTTPQEHDKTIAFTSQLAHVVSSAYIKSPTMRQESGFSAGSFQDLTRVAKLNEDMWTELFMMNQPALQHELEIIIASLQQYRDALDTRDAEKLHELLKEGRILKEWSLAHSITE
ncbi:MAG: prephenate dehydrogenase [Peptococcaceae bacterium]|nr:prephenate dehydrogenase [Peptococcaceae bacterium]